MLSGVNNDYLFPLLLGRPASVPYDARPISTIHGKVVMVTGAGGSIGSELVRQIVAMQPSALLLAELSEFALYDIHQTCDELGFKTIPLIADVRDEQQMLSIMAKHLPHTVFHAAALKHVPMLETEHNKIEAVKTNILGTKNVFEAATDIGVNNVVIVSSDKAVNPSSWMGCTKRMAEGYVIERAATLQRGAGTIHALPVLSVVRFGNVFGSSGSVIPLFRRQIAKGGPVTVTHPAMTRYFMTIREAVELVIDATLLAKIGQGGNLYVLDMGEPVKILQMAEKLIESSGFRPGKDILIEYSGLRPGEKLHEELHYPSEELLPTVLKGINAVDMTKQNLDGFGAAVDEIQEVLDKKPGRAADDITKIVNGMIA